MSIRATVLVPTFDHGETLRYSIPSILNQTVQDLEVVIVGDGMAPAAAAVAREVAASDARVRLVEFAKGPRHGEIYRHQVLQQAKGPVVCYLADDDLYLPNHVEQVFELLKSADLAHTLPSHVLPDGRLVPWTCDLSLTYFRELLASGTNRIPFSCMAHTMAAYRALPHGWRTTPTGTHTDLYMLQQFLAQPGIKAVSGGVPTVVHFASPLRTDWSEQQRLDELSSWAQRVGEPGCAAKMSAELLAWFAQHAATDEAHYRTLEKLLRAQLRQTTDYAEGLTTMLAGVGVQVGASGKS